VVIFQLSLTSDTGVGQSQDFRHFPVSRFMVTVSRFMVTVSRFVKSYMTSSPHHFALVRRVTKSASTRGTVGHLSSSTHCQRWLHRNPACTPSATPGSVGRLSAEPNERWRSCPWLLPTRPSLIGVRMKGKLSCTPRFFLPSVTCWKAI